MSRRHASPLPFSTLLYARIAVLYFGLFSCLSPARAYELRAFGIGDLLLTTSPFSGPAAPGAGALTDAELGLSFKLDVRKVANRVDFKLDFWGREGFVGNSSQQELRVASVTVRDLGGRVDLTLGRFHTPGGFWLIADGGRIDIRYTDLIGQSVYGGLRAFTTGRRNADLDFDSPQALPLAGTALWLRHRLIDASLTFTWARDSIDLQNQLDPATGNTAGNTRLERTVEDEFFLDAQVGVRPTERILLMGGGSFGSRYDIQLSSTNPYGPVQLGVATLGAASGWAIAEWRPVDALRLQYSFNFERIRLIQSQLLAKKADGTRALAANGDFEDHSVRATWLLWHALRAEAQYRLRFRENTDIEHHGVIGLRGNNLFHGFGGFASVGLDVIDPGVTLRTTRILYSGGVSYVNRFVEASGGILFTDGIGSGLTFSQHLSDKMGGTGVHPTELFPYVLETNRVAFIRLFGNWRQFFAGLDVEENLDSAQLRMLVQMGGAR